MHNARKKSHFCFPKNQTSVSYSLSSNKLDRAANYWSGEVIWCSIRDLCLQLIQRVLFPPEAEVMFLQYRARLAPGLQVTPYWVLLASPCVEPGRLPKGALSEE